MAGYIGTAGVEMSFLAKLKEQAMIRTISISIVAAGLLAGCVTPRMATSEERAACAEMEKDMGLGRTHDHAEIKGQGRNAMNLSHDRCVQVLAQPG